MVISTWGMALTVLGLGLGGTALRCLWKGKVLNINILL